MWYDVIIIGGGPAGVSAAVYAARKRIRAVLLLKEYGGQSVVSLDIQNWIGDVSVKGEDLAKKFQQHVEAYKNDVLDVHTNTFVESIKKAGDIFQATDSNNNTYEGTTLLIATGADRRKLDVKGADIFEHKGLTYCASCDGPLFTGQDTVVIGGGNSGFETAAQLLAYTKSVTLLSNNDMFKADSITIEKVLANSRMKAITNATTTAIEGSTLVTGVTYTDKDGDSHTINAAGVFVEIGIVPQTQLVENIVKVNKIKQIEVDPQTQRTSVDGIWAAGDCTNSVYHQNNIAAGDGVKALEDIYLYLTKK